MNVPTGSDSETVGEYFDYLYQHYLGQLTQNFTIHWEAILWVAFWIALLAGSLLLGTRWQRKTRASAEPYPIETYDGYISEGNGPAGPFLAVFFFGMFLWAVGITIFHLVQGQIY